MSDLEDFSFEYEEGGSLEVQQQLPTVCLQCKNKFSEPVILNCLHVFDRSCLVKFESNDGIFPVVICPKCNMQSGSLSSLKPYNIQYAMESNVEVGENGTGESDFKCVLCTSGDEGKYKCVDCAGLLCERCKILHKEVRFLNSHLDVEELTEEDRQNVKSLKKNLADNKPVKCDIHPEKRFTNYCVQCGLLACASCLSSEHVDHSTVPLQDFPQKIKMRMGLYVDKCRKSEEFNKSSIERLKAMLIEVNNSLDENKTHIEEVCNEWKNAIEEIKAEFLKINKEHHDELELKIMSNIQKAEENVDHIEYSLEFTKSYLEKCSNVEFCKIVKIVLSCLSELADRRSETAELRTTMPFKDNISSISNIIRSNFGVFVGNSNNNNNNDRTVEKGSSVSSSVVEFSGDVASCFSQLSVGEQLHDQFKPQSLMLQNGSNISNFEVNPISPTGGYPILPPTVAIDGMNPVNSMEDIMGFSYPTHFENRSHYDDSGVNLMSMMPSTTQTSPPPTFPPIDTFNGSCSNGFLRPGSTGYNPNTRPPFPNRGNQCGTMTIKARWGSLGSGRGEMSSPHGFCLGFQEEIVVADTQNHRIQIFTKDGQFLSQFGVAGRDEGQLWFPRKVAIIRNTQRYVVCDRGNERSRMQIFGRSGHFLRKISIRYIDIVAGLAVNNMGHIVAVDSVSPSVFVVSEGGELIKWFDCSSCMREPSDIAVHGDEYYICDFKGHCVCVFKQDGSFLQRFGNETITNFPNGIDVSDHGDILIGDSHGNRFHIAVYSRDGKLTSEFECPSVKVSRACGLKITSEGYLVTLAKNNHHVLVMDTLYIS